MPRASASFGLEMVTSVPRMKKAPSSQSCTPAMALISVDLPAPLSPTSATTSPASTSKSTPVRASRGPNRLLTPLSARRGEASVVAVTAGTGSSSVPISLDSGSLACCRVGAGADVLGCPEAVRDHGALDVVLGHGDGSQDEGVDLGLSLIHISEPTRPY